MDAAYKLAKEEEEAFGDLCRNSEAVWVALDQGQVVAAAGAEMVQDHPCRVSLTFCVVAPQARGKGLQARLLRARELWAHKEGVSLVETYTHKENKPSLLNLLAANYVVTSFEDPFVVVRKQV